MKTIGRHLKDKFTLTPTSDNPVCFYYQVFNVILELNDKVNFNLFNFK